MLLHLKHLLLEATRKCNMACPHCMRGDAEELSMDYAVIDRIFEDVRQIDHLVLTGGDPTNSVPGKSVEMLHSQLLLRNQRKNLFSAVCRCSVRAI